MTADNSLRGRIMRMPQLHGQLPDHGPIHMVSQDGEEYLLVRPRIGYARQCRGAVGRHGWAIRALSRQGRHGERGYLRQRDLAGSGGGRTVDLLSEGSRANQSAARRHPLPDADRGRQNILQGSQRAYPGIGMPAGRVVGEIEIQNHTVARHPEISPLDRVD